MSSPCLRCPTTVMHVWMTFIFMSVVNEKPIGMTVLDDSGTPTLISASCEILCNPFKQHATDNSIYLSSYYCGITSVHAED